MEAGLVKYIGTIIEGYQKQNFDSGRTYYFKNPTPGKYEIYDQEGGRLIETVSLRSFNKCFEGLNLVKLDLSEKEKIMIWAEKVMKDIVAIFPFEHEWLVENIKGDSSNHLSVRLSTRNPNVFFYIRFQYIFNGSQFEVELMDFSDNFDDDGMMNAYVNFPIYNIDPDFDKKNYPTANIISYIKNTLENQQPINEGLNLVKRMIPSYGNTGKYVTGEYNEDETTFKLSKINRNETITYLNLVEDLNSWDMDLEDFGTGIYHITSPENNKVYNLTIWNNDYLKELNTNGFAEFPISSKTYEEFEDEMDQDLLNEGLNLVKQPIQTEQQKVMKWGEKVITFVLNTFPNYSNEWLDYNDDYISCDLDIYPTDTFFYIRFNYYDEQTSEFTVEAMHWNEETESEEYIDSVSFPIYDYKNLIDFNLDLYPTADIINFIKNNFNEQEPINEGLNLVKSATPPKYERFGKFITWEVADEGLKVSRLNYTNRTPDNDLTIHDILSDLFDADMQLDDYGTGWYYIKDPNNNSVYLVNSYTYDKVEDLNENGYVLFPKSSTTYEEYEEIENEENLDEGLNLVKTIKPKSGSLMETLYNYLVKSPVGRNIDNISFKPSGEIKMVNGEKLVKIDSFIKKGNETFRCVTISNNVALSKYIDPSVDKVYLFTIEDLVDNFLFDPNTLQEGLNLVKKIKRTPKPGDVIRFYRNGDDYFDVGIITYADDSKIWFENGSNIKYTRFLKHQDSDQLLRAWWFDGEQPDHLVVLREGLNLQKVSNNIPIELTTDLLPLISVCMYGTSIEPNNVIYDVEEMSHTGAEKYWEYFSNEKYVESIFENAKSFINKNIIKEIIDLNLGVTGINYAKIHSPTYYNYGCDELYYDLLVSPDYKRLMIHDIDLQDQEILEDFLGEKFKSYSGFDSYMPQTIDQLKEAIMGDNDIERGVAAYLTYKLADNFEEWKVDFYTFILENHNDFEYLRDDTPHEIIEKMNAEINGEEVSWEEEQLDEGLNLIKQTKKYKVEEEYDPDYYGILSVQEMFDFAEAQTKLQLDEDPTLEFNDIVTIDDAIDRIFSTGHRVTELTAEEAEELERLQEGLNLVKNKRPLFVPDDIFVIPSGKVYKSIPHYITKTLENDNVIFVDDDRWCIDNDNEWIIEHYDNNGKLPPKYNDSGDMHYIKKDDDVIVNLGEDNEFLSVVLGFTYDYVIVGDQDGGFYHADPEQLTYVSTLNEGLNLVKTPPIRPKYYDTDITIQIGDNVIAEIGEDESLEEIQASVTGFRHDYVTIVDQDGEYFDVDPEQLTLDEG